MRVRGHGVEYRQIGRLAPALRGAQQQAWIDLAVVGQIQGDMPGTTKERVMAELPVEAAGGVALLGGRELAPGLAQLATQRRAREAFGYDHRKWLPSMPLPA